MKKRFFLKIVAVYIENRKALREISGLAEALRECGIGCAIYTDGLVAEKDAKKRAEEGSEAAACLLVTDSPSWAARMTGQNYPLLAYFHEGNRDEDFSMVRHGMENPGELDPAYLENVYRRCAGIPWDIAETKRCLVRETVTGDVNSFCRIYNDPSVMRYTREQYPDTVREKEYVKAYIEKQYGFYNFGVWTIVDKGSGEVIGRAGFSFREGYELPELGYVVDSAWQRQGIAWEVCCGILEYGKEELGFHRVQTLVEPENTPSLNLCRKLGFREKETVREEGRNFIRLELVL